MKRQANLQIDLPPVPKDISDYSFPYLDKFPRKGVEKRTRLAEVEQINDFGALSLESRPLPATSSATGAKNCVDTRPQLQTRVHAALDPVSRPPDLTPKSALRSPSQGPSSKVVRFADKLNKTYEFPVQPSIETDEDVFLPDMSSNRFAEDTLGFRDIVPSAQQSARTMDNHIAMANANNEQLGGPTVAANSEKDSSKGVKQLSAKKRPAFSDVLVEQANDALHLSQSMRKRQKIPKKTVSIGDEDIIPLTEHLMSGALPTIDTRITDKKSRRSSSQILGIPNPKQVLDGTLMKCFTKIDGRPCDNHWYLLNNDFTCPKCHGERVGEAVPLWTGFDWNEYESGSKNNPVSLITPEPDGRFVDIDVKPVIFNKQSKRPICIPESEGGEKTTQNSEQGQAGSSSGAAKSSDTNKKSRQATAKSATKLRTPKVSTKTNLPTQSRGGTSAVVKSDQSSITTDTDTASAAATAAWITSAVFLPQHVELFTSLSALTTSVAAINCSILPEQSASQSPPSLQSVMYQDDLRDGRLKPRPVTDPMRNAAVQKAVKQPELDSPTLALHNASEKPPTISKKTSKSKSTTSTYPIWPNNTSLSTRAHTGASARRDKYAYTKRV